MQYIIDALSHEVIRGYIRKGYYHRRTPLFHSPSGAIIIAIIFTIPLYFALKHNPIEIFILMIISAFSHLLLDSITEHGIYVNGKRIWKKRIFSYNNPLLNTFFITISIIMLIITLKNLIQI
jgi:membrane-bound metal-dependent hydrolase YbcI (DUF457 family)